MTVDPFRHVPSLRGKIVEPEGSRYRHGMLSEAEWKKQLEDAGYPTYFRLTDEEREAHRAQTMDTRPEDEVWIFAYGSLMWDPGFIFSEIRVAHIDDHHRAFCLRTHLGRGSKDYPGLMAALDTGGTCVGLALKIDPHLVEDETRYVWRREMGSDGYKAEFRTFKTEQGPIQAITFIANQACDRYFPEKDPAETAKLIGTGAGFLGSNLEYVDKLLIQLEHLGIRDDKLADLHRRASEVARQHQAENGDALLQETHPTRFAGGAQSSTSGESR